MSQLISTQRQGPRLLDGAQVVAATARRVSALITDVSRCLRRAARQSRSACQWISLLWAKTHT